MNKMLLSVFIFFFSVLSLKAQDKISVSSEASEGNVFIYYELQGNPDEEYEVSLTLKRTSQPGFSYIPEHLEGDLNEGKYAGGKRKIMWKLSEAETKMFSGGDDFYFEVAAKPAEKSFSWYYYAGAALLAGGAAAAIITWNSQGDSGGKTSTQSLPVPPGRP